jgi:hypothetical protein
MYGTYMKQRKQDGYRSPNRLKNDAVKESVE